MALKLSKHCRQMYTYGICIRCDECGYMTREEMYENLKDSEQQLYNNSEKSIGQTENLLNDISNLDLACKEILKILEEKNVCDKSVKKLSYKVRILSKIARLLCYISRKFMKKVDEVDELCKTIKNRIDF